MNLSINRISKTALCALASAVMLSGCFDDNDSETIVNDYDNALITSVSLSTNTKVCSNLSSYTFTIDHLGTSDEDLIERCASLWQVDEYSQQPGIIFNADSLPVGSVADSIKVSLSYSSPYKVRFFQYDSTLTLQNVTNYADTQIIWFDDYAVTRIEVVAEDQLTNKSYFMKMNVHTQTSDTIMWKYAATGLFDMSDVIDQRVDTLGTTLCWYMMSADSSQQVRTADLTGDITAWSDAQAVTAPSAINLGTLLNWGGKIYGVGYDKQLLATTDGIAWSVASADYSFVNLLGAQLADKNRVAEHLCAIAMVDDTCRFVRSADGASWQLDSLTIGGTTTSALPARFPLWDYTRPISVEADLEGGSTRSRIYISGGMLADSTLTSSTWATDGLQWVEFTQNIVPAARRSSVVRYQLDVDDPDSFWIMQLGERADGSVTDTLYFSQNSGVTWKMLQREFYKYGDTYPIAQFGCSSAFVNPKNYRIYFIGGKNNDGEQESNIVTGQLANLAMDQLR